MTTGSIQYGEVALKASLIINGGASVALLSGAMAANVYPSGLFDSLRVFASGVFLAALAPGAAYLSQTYVETGYIYAERWKDSGEDLDLRQLNSYWANHHFQRSSYLRWISTVIVILSISAFLVGSMMASSSLESWHIAQSK